MRWFLAILAIAACARADAEGPSATASVSVSAGATTAAASAPAKVAATPARKVPEGMVEIKAGIFVMGVAAGNPEERPVHEAIIASVYFDKTEVTMKAYASCMKAGKCSETHQETSRFCNARIEGRDDHPVNCIDWNQADAFCRWAGKRLPTENEWEYVASGGPEQRRFSWGNEDPTPKRACYDHPGGSCPVASFAPGAFGLHDVTGNVWEWTSTRFAPYAGGAEIMGGPSAPLLYVYRGGSWSRRFPKWMRNQLRNRYEPHELSASIGVRCAQSIEPLDCPADTEPRKGECVRVRGTPLSPETSTALASGSPDPKASFDAVANSGPNSGPKGPESEISDTVTRTRTPQHDPDCAKHWPKQPVSYLFSGGKNYPARKPLLKAGGCSPRDMGTSWTSACCSS